LGSEVSLEDKVWNSFNRTSLQNIPAISTEELLARQTLLGKQLQREDVDAFIAEPSGTTQYYANFSAREWELSERPFVLVVTPTELFCLTPLFEVSRAIRLDIPAAGEMEFVTWAEGTLKRK
jgi:hypothetical protein